MDIKPIHSDDDLKAALARVETLWGAPLDTPQGNELEILCRQIEKYEIERYPLPASDPVEAIRFRMDQQGLSSTDLSIQDLKGQVP